MFIFKLMRVSELILSNEKYSHAPAYYLIKKQDDCTDFIIIKHQEIQNLIQNPLPISTDESPWMDYEEAFKLTHDMGLYALHDSLKKMI